MNSNNVLNLKGWESLTPSDDKQGQDRALEVAHWYKQTFESDVGKRVLEMLVQATLVRPVIRPDDTQFGAGIREGRADIVRQILREIEKAEG